MSYARRLIGESFLSLRTPGGRLLECAKSGAPLQPDLERIPVSRSADPEHSAPVDTVFLESDQSVVGVFQGEGGQRRPDGDLRSLT